MVFRAFRFSGVQRVTCISFRSLRKTAHHIPSPFANGICSRGHILDPTVFVAPGNTCRLAERAVNYLLHSPVVMGIRLHA